jgi:predicted DNA-binding protein (MmcQ/YjbR family)
MAKAGVEESFPFDNETLVWKVAGKMFCLCNIHNFSSLNLKCDPEKSMELREMYPQITPGYHMNKKLWNTVILDGLSEKLIFELIDHSYDEVVRKLPKKVQESLKGL